MFDRNKYKMTLLAASTVLFFIIVGASSIGTAQISFKEVLSIIFGKIVNTHSLIIWDIRLPRILLAALVGAGLSVVGAVFQGMFRNQMADPYILGVSSGAALGATIIIALGIEQSVIYGAGLATIAAFIFAIITVFAVYNFGKRNNIVFISSLLLSGLAINYFLSSLISIIMMLNRKHLERIIFWVMGSFTTASWQQLIFLIPIIFVGVIIIVFLSRDLNILATGEDTAKSLGVEVEKVKKILLFVSTLIVAACVSVSGIIGFVGLIIPHIVRLVVGADHRKLLPFSVVFGAIFMIICDTTARVIISPSEVPVGAVTALLGVPFFIYLLVKNNKKVA